MSLDDTKRCAVCLSEGTPDSPVNCVADSDEGEVWLCFSAEDCTLRVAEQLESAEVSCVP